MMEIRADNAERALKPFQNFMFQRRQKELALLSNEIEDDGHLARARRKQVTK